MKLWQVILLIILAVKLGMIGYESDLIGQCKQSNTVELWHSKYKLTCIVTKR